ncbi:FAD-dependent oxidoreductase [Isoptericola aurantiacus]|uniref:FAD-dependent oxidoreductase n=1 Tax=Isoptericola aurantiacus TaxID=3377839 RepID=UPI00383BB49F
MTTALVISGGIGGTAAAVALTTVGIDVTVLERRHDDEAEGSFLTLGSNGIDALAALGLDTAVAGVGFPTPVLTMVSGTGKVLGDSRTSATLPGAPTSRTVRRAELARALRDEARRRGVEIVTGQHVVGLTRPGTASRPAGVRLADGTEAAADLVVAADGIHSRIRPEIVPDAPGPEYTGLVGLGGDSPAGIVDEPPGSFRMIFGRRAFFGYATAPDEQVWWFANVPQPREPVRGEPESIDAETWRHRLTTLFADDAGPAVALLRAATRLTPASPMHTVPRLRRWHAGRTALLGDAAHAPSPSSGQGASLAVEDAVALALALGEQGAVLPALAAYEAARRPRVERIVAQARRVNSSKAATGLARWLRDAILPVVLRRTAGGPALREVYDHHLTRVPDLRGGASIR